MMTTSLSRVSAKFTAFILVAAGAVSCGLDKQTAPELAGPSEFGLSLTLRALPDTLVADGVSQSAIQVTARDANGRPVPGLGLSVNAVDATANLITPVLTQTSIVTDANGVATVGLVAPDPPATQFAIDPIVMVTATPIGTDAGNMAGRSVQVRVRAPEGTPPGRPAPVAKIVASRGTVLLGESITFDASYSTDQGVTCANRCDYIWEYPGGDPVRAMTITRTFTVPGTFTMTLTVTNEVGGVDTDSVAVRVIGPADPVASFSVSPSSPRALAEAMFDASGSTVGSGATIARYDWDFDDGNTDSRDTARAPHVYSAAGTYTVTLTVTDSLGRTASTTSTITVIP